MTLDTDSSLDRRETLKCMLWAGSGVVWTVSGGVPSSQLVEDLKMATTTLFDKIGKHKLAAK